MKKLLLLLPFAFAACDMLPAPVRVESPKEWIFQMPSVHGIPGDTVGHAEYLVCADSLHNGDSCEFRGMRGTYEEAFDASYLDGKDSTVQWPHFENVGPLYVGRR